MNKSCPRCGEPLRHSWTVSMFNLDTICLDCKMDERGAPNYQRAVDTESAAVQRGERNFPGIGLAPEDRAYLLQKRSERSKHS